MWQLLYISRWDNCSCMAFATDLYYLEKNLVRWANISGYGEVWDFVFSSVASVFD